MVDYAEALSTPHPTAFFLRKLKLGNSSRIGKRGLVSFPQILIRPPTRFAALLRSHKKKAAETLPETPRNEMRRVAYLRRRLKPSADPASNSASEPGSGVNSRLSGAVPKPNAEGATMSASVQPDTPVNVNTA
jgi:hypothetical protein